jgi:hypothetical protein
MKRTGYERKGEQGNTIVVALMLLGVLTLIGLAVSRMAGIDIQIAANEIPYKQSFYISQGGVNREAAEVGQGNYPVTNIYDFPATLAVDTDTNLPGPTHEIAGEDYEFTLEYFGYYLPPAGYSAVHFSRYDYMIGVESGEADVYVGSRYYKIGPKAS